MEWHPAEKYGRRGQHQAQVKNTVVAAAVEVRDRLLAAKQRLDLSGHNFEADPECVVVRQGVHRSQVSTRDTKRGKEMKKSTNPDFEKDRYTDIRDIVTTIVHNHMNTSTPMDIDKKPIMIVSEHEEKQSE